jgi:hypothetical protein
VIWAGVLAALVLLAREIGSRSPGGGAYRFTGRGGGSPPAGDAAVERRDDAVR